MLNNVTALTTYPVVGALLIEAFGERGASAEPRLSTAPIVFGVYLAANFLNFLLIVGYLCLRDRTSLLDAIRRLYLPVFPWQVATGTLTAGTVLAYQEIGLLAVGLLAVTLLSYTYLLGAVVDAQRQRDELREQVEELEALHSGVIRVIVETLGMRDRMTARHSAAVARFAKATAAAAGLSVREQELVHTAGLLHDVGKFTFPDHTLTGTSLTEEDWALIYSHPQRGADIVGRVRGYADVAEIVLCHHERIDGRGYPRNLSGERHPAARPGAVRGGLLRRDDGARLLSPDDADRGCDRGASPGRRHPARRPHGRGLRGCRRRVRAGLPTRRRRRPRGGAGRQAPRGSAARAGRGRGRQRAGGSAPAN